MNFNIFYLNFSKVYGTKMLINNIIKEKITKEKMYNTKSTNELGFSNDIFSLKYSDSESEYYKLTETLKVKEAKSVILKEILKNCITVTEINNIKEGDLILLNDINIEFFDDEENEKMLSLLSKEALRGLEYGGFDVNNFILKYFNDSAYHLKCKFKKEELVFKIPIENDTEFESKYSVNDLLIGKLSIIGIYKGKISETDFKKSNFLNTLDKNNTQQQNLNNKIVMSNNESNNNITKKQNLPKELKYIDIFAIIQNINFVEEPEINTKTKSFWTMINKKINKIFRGN